MNVMMVARALVDKPLALLYLGNVAVKVRLTGVALRVVEGERRLGERAEGAEVVRIVAERKLQEAFWFELGKLLCNLPRVLVLLLFSLLRGLVRMHRWLSRTYRRKRAQCQTKRQSCHQPAAQNCFHECLQKQV